MKKDYSLPTKITISEKTKQDYLKRAENMVKRIAKEKGKSEIDVYEMVMWLIDNAHTINKNSFRLYKASILYYLYDHLNTKQSIEAADYLVNFDSGNSYKKSNKTSSKKSKKIRKDDLEILIQYLNQENNKWDSYIKTWILSGILCGLRPIEWQDAELSLHTSGQYILKIKNAKNTNGRANGDYRTLLLDRLSENEISIIKQQLYNIKSFASLENNGYERFYNNCIVRLNQVNQIVFKKRKKNITLYSSRHQFSANAKYSNRTKAEVAALMGHASDETATSHYGRKIYGNSQIGVKPLKENVDSVKNLSKPSQQRKNYPKLVFDGTKK